MKFSAWRVLIAGLELVKARSIRTDSNDVTADVYDVEARIRNTKEEETRSPAHADGPFNVEAESA